VPTPIAALLAAALGAALGAGFNLAVRRLPPGRPVAHPELVAGLTAALCAAVVLVRHSTTDRVLGIALVTVLVATSLIDIQTRKIPNRLLGPAAAGALLIGLVLHPAGVPVQLVAGAAGGCVLLLFALVHPRGLGMGDVKLAGVLGLYLGGSVAVALFAGVLVGAFAGLAVIARVGVVRGRKTGMPFGPFLAAGALVALAAGPQILHWYAHSLVR
jgi:leader peptidase (prepilin peptidase)/N-methyltransferase